MDQKEKKVIADLILHDMQSFDVNTADLRNRLSGYNSYEIISIMTVILNTIRHDLKKDNNLYFC